MAAVDFVALVGPSFNVVKLFSNSSRSRGCLLEAVRAKKRVVDLENVNRVLRQPHWREDTDMPGMMG